MENFIIQVGAPADHKDFTKDVKFPSYRLQFDKDATQKEVIATLPPALKARPVFSREGLLSGSDRNGNPIEIAHLLSWFPSLPQPGEKEVDLYGDIGHPEATTAEQNRDLVEFLRRF